MPGHCSKLHGKNFLSSFYLCHYRTCKWYLVKSADTRPEVTNKGTTKRTPRVTPHHPPHLQSRLSQSNSISTSPLLDPHVILTKVRHFVFSPLFLAYSCLCRYSFYPSLTVHWHRIQTLFISLLLWAWAWHAAFSRISVLPWDLRSEVSRKWPYYVYLYFQWSVCVFPRDFHILLTVRTAWKGSGAAAAAAAEEHKVDKGKPEWD